MGRMNIFAKRVRISGTIDFNTAFHIGSGKEGDLATDMGILKDVNGTPILPGSTLKGNFRSLAERLAGYLGLKACLLDTDLSGIACVSDEKYREKVFDEFKEMTEEGKKLIWLKEKTCDVCSLFGSPLQASRIFFKDGEVLDWARSLQVRDGVSIDRDSETARHGAKYDFEVVPQGANFSVQIDLENPGDEDLALVGAVIAEWENGFRLGGFTSRGLGKAQFTNSKIEQVDYSDPQQLRDYLLKREMASAPKLLADKLAYRLQQVPLGKGGPHA